MTIAQSVWLAYAMPLVGLALITLFGNRLSRSAAAWLGTAVMLVSGAIGVWTLARLADLPADKRVITDTLYTWIVSGALKVDVNLYYDQLAAVMLIVVSGIGALIHLYSVGYMKGDDEERRFFAYLNLFVFSMLTLVLTGNMIILLAGWGLVGLSSYLLIGFWHTRPAAIAAAKKAFVMNAVGDVGLALGIFLIFKESVGTSSGGSILNYTNVFAQRGSFGFDTTITCWICGLLLVGALAKSAQLPLHTWLPDAMEGPTPISALIHAATMVTAGVYLIARLNPLYSYAPTIQHVIVAIGVLGLLMAGCIALAQNDIKRVIAFSTMSQIAYMFVGVGLGAYWAGIFHLFTHAFFKALLFLGAGIVIHALHDEQDIRKMGGLRKWMPRTTILMWIGALALCGIPPFSGAWSKDSIIASGLQVGGFWGYFAFIGGLAGAFITGLYTTRMMIRVFHGSPSEFAEQTAPEHTKHHEGPWTMMLPVAVLAVGALAAGWLNIPGVTDYFYTWLEPISGSIPQVDPTVSEDWSVTVIGGLIGLAGIGLAWRIWAKRPVDQPVAMPAALVRLAERRFYWDDFYDLAFYRIAAHQAGFLTREVEPDIYQGTVGGAGRLAQLTSRWLGGAQTGVVRAYVMVFAVGIAGLLFYFSKQA